MIPPRKGLLSTEQRDIPFEGKALFSSLPGPCLSVPAPTTMSSGFWGGAWEVGLGEVGEGTSLTLPTCDSPVLFVLVP